MKKLNSGFTLIEIMIMMAALGILTALALPLYKEHIQRAQFTEILGGIAERQGEIEEFAAMKLRFPTNAEKRYWDPITIQGSTGLIYTSLAGNEYIGRYHSYQISAWLQLGNHTEYVNYIAKMDNQEHPGAVSWSCESNAKKNGDKVKPLYAPAGCR
ncbi:pilin [Pelagibaculum spongiae]|uniref:Pilus assembly protein PilE n=1 Tax=Pelagibaculum spongiae TaxID=2080658 RepID=A0A2V1GRN3_9GAMM|nr:pilin [Pelagibaculum spongiae]PVZ67748.1 hypothetical protein DC094_15045 [Pelagibaculum spongiae]